MKLNLTLLAILFCCHGMAQQKFIEVTVSDTVLAKADLFVYQIMLTPEEDFAEFERPSKNQRSMEDIRQERQMKGQRSLDSLKSALMAEGYMLVKPSLEESFNIYQREMRIPSISIMTRSVDSLTTLCHQLQHQKGLVGILQVAIASHDSSYQDKLFKKILDKARKKAQSIADFSNLHIQGVLAVTENKTEGREVGGWTSYPPLSDLAESIVPGWHTTVNSTLKNIVIADLSSIGWYPLAGSFTVRFWVE